MDEYYNLHKRHTKGIYHEKWLELIWTHSLITLEVAKLLIRNVESKGILIDKDLLQEGVMLHDIGVYHCFDEDMNPDKNLPPYIYHGFIGADILLEEGYPESVARFAKTHSATGFTIEDIEREGINVPKEDYLPISVEEEILCYADKFHTKHPAFATYDSQVEGISKFDPNRKVRMETLRKKYGVPNLEKLISKYEQWNRSFDDWFSTR